MTRLSILAAVIALGSVTLGLLELSWWGFTVMPLWAPWVFAAPVSVPFLLSPKTEAVARRLLIVVTLVSAVPALLAFAAVTETDTMIRDVFLPHLDIAIAIGSILQVALVITLAMPDELARRQCVK